MTIEVRKLTFDLSKRKFILLNVYSDLYLEHGLLKVSRSHEFEAITHYQAFWYCTILATGACENRNVFLGPTFDCMVLKKNLLKAIRGFRY